MSSVSSRHETANRTTALSDLSERDRCGILTVVAAIKLQDIIAEPSSMLCGTDSLLQ
nr:hypothetical 6K protein - Plectonema sp. plasmid pRF1 [Plectonema sp.]